MIDINNKLPDEVEDRARKLLDDDQFIDRVWAVLAGYHDMRGMELLAMDRESAKIATTDVIRAVKKLLDVTKRYDCMGLYYADYAQWENSIAGRKRDSFPSHRIQSVMEIETHYTEHLRSLQSLAGRSTMQRSLRWLAGSLSNVFAAYGVPSRKLNGFIVNSIVAITPKGGKPPSKRAIETAVSKTRN